MKETIDITPSWQTAVSILLESYKHGTGEGPRAAKEELLRLASIVDNLKAQREEQSNLKATLMHLGNALVHKYGFEPGSFPINAFTDWLNETPAARHALRELGYGWPVVEQNHGTHVDGGWDDRDATGQDGNDYPEADKPQVMEDGA